jgi:glycosyltransferase involved in cell wall biosynthesis
MKVAVLGLRGIPNVMGGIESHCQNLYPRLVKQGVAVTVIGRSPYLDKAQHTYEGVTIKPLWTFKSKFLETFLHTFVGVIYTALIIKPDIIHIHAIGPALFAPFARLLGLKVVVTHHGADYDRKKWNKFAKLVLKLGEKMGAKFSNSLIVVGNTLTKRLKNEYTDSANKLVFIPNGTLMGFADNASEENLPDDISIQPRNYILAVSRLVPEKGVHELISAYEKSRTKYKLVIVGDADHDDEYAKSIRKRANENIIIAGKRVGKALASLYKYCSVFVLPSYHEGHPIVALEAISAGSNVLLSDIQPNKDIGLPSDCYFRVGNTEALASKITHLHTLDLSFDKSAFLEKYNWDNIALQTLREYKKVVEQLK